MHEVAMVPASPHAPLAPELAAALEAIEALTNVDPAVLADGGSVVALAAGMARLEAVACQQAAAFELHGEWRSTGAKQSAMWVMVEARQRKTVPFRRCRIGRWLPNVAAVRAAFLAGEINEDHVKVLWTAAHASDDTRFAFESAEADLVDWARTMRFDDFCHAIDLWRLHADRISAEDDAERQREQRELHLSQSLDGMWFLDGLLDPISGEIIDTALARIYHELFEADWATAKARLGRKPSGLELAEMTRTPGQRRADALVEMASRSQAVPPGARMPRPLFTLLVGEETFAQACQLASGTITTPGSLAAWLDESVIERIVFDGPDRILSVGYQRSFTGAVRRAIQVRDRRCTHPYCDHPAAGCETDHERPYAEGGETSQANGHLRCPYHHRQHTERQNGKRSKRPRRRTSSDGDDPES